MKFAHVTLRAPSARLPELEHFYGARLGLAGAGAGCFQVGETGIEFAPGAGAPFYHFALLVPGNRFDAALEWVGAFAEILPVDGAPDVVFDSWHAHACYFHDPAGNIVELIAHRGIGETGSQGRFHAGELLGASELGLVGDPPAIAAELQRGLGIELWDGTLSDPGGVAFVGERARTLILTAEGRGWMPTGRPAEVHELDLLLSGVRPGRVALEGGRYRISCAER